MRLLRDRLLEGRRMVLSGGAERELSAPLRELGAHLETLESDSAHDEESAAAWVRERLPLDVLIHDAGGAFAEYGLQPALERAWVATRTLATEALIPAETGGKVILIAPRPRADHAEAAAAALENLVRTLSVEWARHGITAVAIAPGPATRAVDLATIAAFVGSRAGDYLSGCRLELGALARAT